MYYKNAYTKVLIELYIIIIIYASKMYQKAYANYDIFLQYQYIEYVYQTLKRIINLFFR